MWLFVARFLFWLFVARFHIGYSWRDLPPANQPASRQPSASQPAASNLQFPAKAAYKLGKKCQIDVVDSVILAINWPIKAINRLVNALGGQLAAGGPQADRPNH